MRIAVIGGTGHIGSYLVPMLHQHGHEVVVLSRGQRRPYHEDPAWDVVEQVQVDRTAEDGAGTFGDRVAALGVDAVADLTCFTPESARRLVEALPAGRHVVHTGSIWAYGRSLVVPVTEDTPKAPYGEYGVNKARIEDYLLRDQSQVRATVIHPGHITGPGWVPINPAGNTDVAVYAGLVSTGRAVLPDRGMELVQHVHAADVAALHVAALEAPEVAGGEAFNSVADQSLTLRGYAELLAREYGHEPDLELLPWTDFVDRVGERHAAVTADHIARSPHHSTAKAERLLGFRPTYSAWDAVREAVAWLVSEGRL